MYFNTLAIASFAAILSTITAAPVLPTKDGITKRFPAPQVEDLASYVPTDLQSYRPTDLQSYSPDGGALPEKKRTRSPAPQVEDLASYFPVDKTNYTPHPIDGDYPQPKDDSYPVKRQDGPVDEDYPPEDGEDYNSDGSRQGFHVPPPNPTK